MDSIELPQELWQVVLAHFTTRELAQMCLVSSNFLEISRDVLYRKLAINDDPDVGIIGSLGQHLVRRLHHLTVDMRCIDRVLTYTTNGKTTVQALLDLLNVSDLRSLHVSSPQYSTRRRDPSFLSVFLNLIKLPTVKYLKMGVPPLETPDELTQVLQAGACRDLDVVMPNQLSMLPKPAEPSSITRPSLDTFRIRNGAVFWKVLSYYFDLGSLRRLAVWDFENAVRNIERGWGDLVLLSAPTLEYLSFWLTNGILAFYECSPALRHIRIYIHGYSLQLDTAVSKFATELRELLKIKTIRFSCEANIAEYSKDETLKMMLPMFHPVHLTLEFGESWKRAWPFFDDDDTVKP
ncbi:hypothetical protein DL96DRAFT_1610146 [Flagelloscypha sp. PMI_526]|nr:hypothetical protein DL96DRAFT_1610146 [Flagelloscypha sp. PMI_526]